MWRKGKPCALLVGMHTGADTVQSSINTPQKIKNGTAYDPMIPLLGCYPKEPKTLNQKNTHNPMFIAASFTIDKILKQPKCPSVDECIKKAVVCIHKGLLLAHKKEGNLTFVTAWMNLEGVLH